MTVRKAQHHVEICPANDFRYVIFLKMVYLACFMMLLFLIASMIGMEGRYSIKTRWTPTGNAEHSENFYKVDNIAQAGIDKSQEVASSSDSYPTDLTSSPSTSHELRVPTPSNVKTLRTLANIRIITHEPPPASATIKPLKYLPGYSTTEHYIKKDGNCLFRTFAHFKYEDQEKHIQVRQEMIQYIEANPFEFQDFVEGEDPEPEIRLKKYLYKMKNGAWGDELSIKALSEAYELNVVVVSVSDRSMYAQLHVGNKGTTGFRGAYLQNDHYELLFQA
ncbi:OTU domain containing [Puccinia graminis f. sp. tritici]|uniref:OTU domain-containing protein 1 n=2 Tax=Puccinia graminis f. sp. tritici TaxID=56615 RepID=A0A5B0SGV1_PUCGR|nr:OTU domain containing [Puccinia graminis f. sp. tritici]